MIINLMIGIIGVVALAFGWLIVQVSWKRIFGDLIEDEDVLADRVKCGNCNCKTICTNKL